MAVVVFPPPPFWLATAMTRPIQFFRRTGAARSIVRIDCDLQRRNLVQSLRAQFSLNRNRLENISNRISTGRMFHVEHFGDFQSQASASSELKLVPRHHPVNFESSVNFNRTFQMFHVEHWDAISVDWRARRANSVLEKRSTWNMNARGVRISESAECRRVFHVEHFADWDTGCATMFW